MIKGEAIVIKNSGSHYYLSVLPEWAPFPAIMRGRTRLERGRSTNPVAVGDRVRFERPDSCSEQNPASITDILERNNHLIRKSTNLSRQSHVIAANLDRAIIVTTLFFPEVKLPFLDRLLVTCEIYKIPVTIALNKTDMYADETPEAIEEFCRIYSCAGYEVVPCSARTGLGIERLRELCRDGVCLLGGESGVGKSSIVKALDPKLNPKTGAISEAHLQGMHTTSLYEMYPLSGGGFVIDTPGLRGFGLVNLEKEEIYKYFPEMLEASRDCRFTPCSHTHEPGCAVRAALDEGRISAQRYNSYLGMLENDGKFRQ